MANVLRHRVTMLGRRRRGSSHRSKRLRAFRTVEDALTSRRRPPRRPGWRAWDHGEGSRLPADGYVGAALLPRRGDPHALEGADGVTRQPAKYRGREWLARASHRVTPVTGTTLALD